MNTARRAPTASLPRMALPLVVSFSLRQAFGLVDLIYARFLGDSAAVAAVGLFIPFQEIYIALWVGLSAGFTATLAGAFGNFDSVRVQRLKRAMLLIQGAFVPVLALGGVGLWFVIPHLPLEPDLAAAFRIYGPTLLIGLPLTGFWSIYPDSIVKAHYDTRTTMLAGIYATGCNVLLNTLFVFAFGWGIFGIALATVLSRLVALLYATSKADGHERRRLADPDWADATPVTRVWGAPTGSILLLGLPASVTFVLTSLENTLVNGLLTRTEDSTEAIASYGVYYSLLRLASMPAIATSVAVLPFVARMVPEGQSVAVRRDLRIVLLMAAGFAVVFTLPVGVLFPDAVAGFFLPESTAGALADPLTRDVLRLLPLAALAAVPFLIVRPVFEALERPRAGIAIAVLRFAVLSYPCILLGRTIASAAGGSALLGIVGGLITASASASLITALLARRILRKPIER